MNLEARVQFIERQWIKDGRGSFLKIMHGREPYLPARTGEIYAVWAQPGQSRAGHFHPQTAEWFTVLRGECRMVIVDPVNGERLERVLRESEPVTVYVPAGLAHRFDNLSATDEFMLLAYAENCYDPRDTVLFVFGD